MNGLSIVNETPFERDHIMRFIAANCAPTAISKSIAVDVAAATYLPV